MTWISRLNLVQIETSICVKWDREDGDVHSSLTNRRRVRMVKERQIKYKKETDREETTRINWKEEYERLQKNFLLLLRLKNKTIIMAYFIPTIRTTVIILLLTGVLSLRL